MGFNPSGGMSVGLSRMQTCTGEESWEMFLQGELRGGRLFNYAKRRDSSMIASLEGEVRKVSFTVHACTHQRLKQKRN